MPFADSDFSSKQSPLANIVSHDVVSRDALAIWEAGVEAVRSDHVVASQTDWDGRWLTLGEHTWDLKGVRRLLIVGAGKATYGMLVGLLRVLRQSGHPLPALVGWINVPEGLESFPVGVSQNSVPQSIQVWQARPKGANEPTEKVVHGTRRILDLVRTADPSDFTIALISGGGSALLCSPLEPLTLEEKVKVTRALSNAGANIEQLNSVRRCLSSVKGGGLARACRSRRLVTCILSDVLGDPLEIIASGPTILAPEPNPLQALQILDSLLPGQFQSIRTMLSSSMYRSQRADGQKTSIELTNVLLANNATAVDAAGCKAVELGYRYWMQSASKSEGDVSLVGRQIASQIAATCGQDQIDCLISGGEPTVTLPKNGTAGLGGRNQQLALTVLQELNQKNLWDMGFEIAFVSGGTDGEDGPTDAAGAIINQEVLRRMNSLGLSPVDYLKRCDAYRFFEQTGGLLKTGATHTNVCDLRVAVLSRSTNAKASRT